MNTETLRRERDGLRAGIKTAIDAINHIQECLRQGRYLDLQDCAKSCTEMLSRLATDGGRTPDGSTVSESATTADHRGLRD